MEEVKAFYPKNREEWRKWLEKNHLKEKKIGLVRYKKHTGKPSLTHMEAMHEAICFGWIDTTVNRIDDEKYLINFSRRNEKSKWSDNTISYGKSLLKDGKMSPFGIKMFKEGLAKPTHDHGIPKNPDMPIELKREVEKNKTLKEKFEKVSPSAKRMYYRMILRGKQEETRKKTAEKIIKIVLNDKKGW
jgi:uncharacterized protein YdeI (YjbR/CyaY-like superfamily)